MTDPLPLADLRVIDASTIFAGPMTAMHLGDLGAEVIKIEHPRMPDSARVHGVSKDGHNLWWKTLGRNKRTIQLDLSRPEGQDVFRALCADTDVVVENFRPDTFERWGLGYDVLSGVNPRLVLCRMTGFGQDGPYRRRPGFGTLAEAMSGFAAASGQPGDPPLLPPFGLADGIASLAAAFGVMSALHQRSSTGRGQVVDVAIIEPIMAMLGPQLTRWELTRTVEPRMGNRSMNNAPRNIYQTVDGHWVAVSASALSIAERVMTLVGRPEYLEQPWFGSGETRALHGDELDGAVAAWIAQRTRAEVIDAFEQAQAAVAPVYTPADILADPHLQHRGTIEWIEDPDLGRMPMQGPLFRMSDAALHTRWAGRSPGADTREVLRATGLTDERLEQLRADGVIGWPDDQADRSCGA